MLRSAPMTLQQIGDAADPTTLMALPRIVQSWGYRSQSPA